MSEEISPEQHAADHKGWQEVAPELREFLADRKATKERWEKVRAQVIGGMILSALGGIAWLLGWIGEVVMEAIRSGRHP